VQPAARTALCACLDPACLYNATAAGALWCLALFSDLTPELWNAATALLAQPQAAAALQPAALTQLYQVRGERQRALQTSERCMTLGF
jgi:hypothetical protein